MEAYFAFRSVDSVNSHTSTLPALLSPLNRHEIAHMQHLFTRLAPDQCTHHDDGNPMPSRMHVDVDILGVGMGPANLCLAIALDEVRQRRSAPVITHFIEKKTRFSWHAPMLLDGARMQISFLKDLVTLRNPLSRFSFINYLNEQGRLLDFVNRNTFHPSRREFDNYLRWAAAHFSDQCSYGESVQKISKNPCNDGIRVESMTMQGVAKMYNARAVVIAAGSTAHIPDAFQPTVNAPNVIHSSGYLDQLSTLDLPKSGPRRIAVIGAGQSAAEIFLDLYRRFPDADLEMLHRGVALRQSDSSPFVNRIFDPAFVDFFYQQDAHFKQQLIASCKHTNYGAVDSHLLESISNILYQDKVQGGDKRQIKPFSIIEKTRYGENGRIDIRYSHTDKESAWHAYDLVILATGYMKSETACQSILDESLRDFTIDRNYRICCDRFGQLPIYVQGASEAQHGLSDTLLSNMASRAGSISESLVDLVSRQQTAPEKTNLSRAFVPPYSYDPPNGSRDMTVNEHSR